MTDKFVGTFEIVDLDDLYENHYASFLRPCLSQQSPKSGMLDRSHCMWELMYANFYMDHLHSDCLDWGGQRERVAALIEEYKELVEQENTERWKFPRQKVDNETKEKWHRIWFKLWYRITDEIENMCWV